MDIGERIVNVGINLIYYVEDFFRQPGEQRERFITATLVIIGVIAYVWWWGSYWWN